MNLIVLNNLFYKFILWNLFNFSMISLFFSDLILIWFFMEINTFLFICYMCFLILNKKIIFFYYLIQSLASLLLIFSLIMNNFFLFNLNLFILIFYFSLMLKLGIPPFHLWMPTMSFYLNWNTMFIFLTIQKIIPFYMFSLIEMKILFLYFMILSSSYLSMIKMINLFNFKVLLIYSSINQTSWMLLLIFFKNLFWLIYMIFYSLILFIIFMFISTNKFNSYFFINKFYSLNFNLICLLMIFNLASIPPFSFFLMKWLSIFIFLMNSNLYLIFFLLIINSFILIYIYLNIMILSLFFYSIKSKFFFMNQFNLGFNFKNNSFFLFISLFLSLFLLLL